MAYGFGSGVRAELGATDYSNYLRGALTGAQMQAQGGAAIGAGVQNALDSVGQGIAQGIQSFQKRQKENSILTGQIGAMAQQAGVGEFLDGKNKKLLEQFIDPEKELNNDKLSQLMASLSVASTQKQQQETQRQAAQKIQTDAAMVAAQIQNLAYRNSLASAQATALGNPKPPSLTDFERVYQSQIDALEEREGRTATAEERAKISMDVRQASKSTTNVNLPGQNTEDTETAKAKIERRKERLVKMEAAATTIAEIDQLTKHIYDSGDLINFGPLAEIMNYKDKILGFLGNEEAALRASNTELTKAMQGSGVFKLFQQLGVGARGIDTPAERDFMLAVLTGNIEQMRDTMLEMNSIRREKAVKDADAFFNHIDKSPEYFEWVMDFNDGLVPHRDQFPLAPPTKPEGLTWAEWAIATPEQRAKFR